MVTVSDVVSNRGRVLIRSPATFRKSFKKSFSSSGCVIVPGDDKVLQPIENTVGVWVLAAELPSPLNAMKYFLRKVSRSDRIFGDHARSVFSRRNSSRSFNLARTMATRSFGRGRSNQSACGDGMFTIRRGRRTQTARSRGCLRNHPRSSSAPLLGVRGASGNTPPRRG